MKRVEMICDYATSLVYEEWLKQDTEGFDAEKMAHHLQEQDAAWQVVLMYAEMNRIAMFVQAYRSEMPASHRMAWQLFLYRRDLLLKGKKCLPEDWKAYVASLCCDTRPFHESGVTRTFRNVACLLAERVQDWTEVMNATYNIQYYGAADGRFND